MVNLIKNNDHVFTWEQTFNNLDTVYITYKHNYNQNCESNKFRSNDPIMTSLNLTLSYADTRSTWVLEAAPMEGSPTYFLIQSVTQCGLKSTPTDVCLSDIPGIILPLCLLSQIEN